MASIVLWKDRPKPQKENNQQGKSTAGPVRSNLSLPGMLRGNAPFLCSQYTERIDSTERFYQRYSLQHTVPLSQNFYLHKSSRESTILLHSARPIR